MASVNFSEEKAITIELANEKAIQTEVQDINYIPAYKQAEEERRTNELERIANEEERETTYNKLTEMIEEGKVTGIYIGEEKPTDEMIDVWIDPNGNPEVKASNIVFSDNETLQTKYENGELKGEQGIQGEKGEKGDTGEQGIQGIQGVQGEQGIAGKDGADGYTPVKGTDYFTNEDIASLNIPTKTSDLTNDSGFLTKTLDTYSASEQVIGTWLSGEPIYRKVILHGTIGETDPITFTDTNNYKRIINEHHFMYSDGMISLPYTLHSDGQYAEISTSVNGSGTLSLLLKRANQGQWSDWSLCSIIDYTKTTD